MLATNYWHGQLVNSQKLSTNNQWKINKWPCNKMAIIYLGNFGDAKAFDFRSLTVHVCNYQLQCNIVKFYFMERAFSSTF